MPSGPGSHGEARLCGPPVVWEKPFLRSPSVAAAPWRGTESEVTRAHRGTVLGADGQQGGWGLRLLFRDALGGASSCFVAFYRDVRCAGTLAVGDYRADATSVNRHLRRSCHHAFCWRLRSTVFSLWLYFVTDNAKAPFWEALVRPRPGVRPAVCGGAFLARRCRARGSTETRSGLQQALAQFTILCGSRADGSAQGHLGLTASVFKGSSLSRNRKLPS